MAYWNENEVKYGIMDVLKSDIKRKEKNLPF